MSSIIVSFVGKQDPFGKDQGEGSIVSLVKHLCQQQQSIKRVILLFTEDTSPGAIDTQTWLTTDLALAPEAIQLVPVDAQLSDDPVNLLLAAQAARSGLEQAQRFLDPTDILEFNASSGTPVMKSSWSILQAAGYAPRSRVWQVRNPNEMRSHQDRVHLVDVNILKDEFDLKVIRQQVQDYNYSGAAITLQETNLNNPVTLALLSYGYHRRCLNFDLAFSMIDPLRNQIDERWIQEITPLRQKMTQALLQEAYFNAVLRLKAEQYADFLVGLFKLQEQILYFLVKEKLGLDISGRANDKERSYGVIRQVDEGQLYAFLQGYVLPRGEKLDLNRGVSRYVFQAIVEYYPQFATIAPLIQDLNTYCDLRNSSVHGFVGVSEIENEEMLLKNLHQLMKQITRLPDRNPFDSLNEAILDSLSF